MVALLSTARRACCEQGQELIEVHRLREVGVEARRDRLAHVLGLAVAGERDEAGGAQARRSRAAGAPPPCRRCRAGRCRTARRRGAPRGRRHAVLAAPAVSTRAPSASSMNVQHRARVVVVLHDEDRAALEPAALARAPSPAGRGRRRPPAAARRGSRRRGRCPRERTPTRPPCSSVRRRTRSRPMPSPPRPALLCPGGTPRRSRAGPRARCPRRCPRPPARATRPRPRSAHARCGRPAA